MKVGLEWLREWVPLNADVGALAHQLTMAGFEVEGRSLAATPFAGIVVGAQAPGFCDKVGSMVGSACAIL